MTSESGAQPPPRQVIFIDFGGVISTDEFWLSLRQDGHPLKARLDTGMQKIWHESPGTSRAWMRGELSFAEVLAEMGLTGEDSGFLDRALRSDARRMRVHPGIAELLPAWAGSGAELVLGTDNAPQLAAAFEDARTLRGRGAGPPATMEDAAPWFSGTVCSCETGVLKAEDPARFFGPWLARHGRGFGDALLVDDRADNCEAFTRTGGAAVRWHLSDDVSRLAGPVAAWLAAPGPGHVNLHGFYADFGEGIRDLRDPAPDQEED